MRQAGEIKTQMSAFGETVTTTEELMLIIAKKEVQITQLIGQLKRLSAEIGELAAQSENQKQVLIDQAEFLAELQAEKQTEKHCEAAATNGQ